MVLVGGCFTRLNRQPLWHPHPPPPSPRWGPICAASVLQFVDFLDPVTVVTCLRSGVDRLCLGGRLKRSARAVQLFGRLAVVETHTL